MKSKISFDTKAGRLVLNFTNTVYERPGYSTASPAAPIELLKDVEDLNRWLGCVEAFSKSTLTEISRELRSESDGAVRILRKVIALREQIFVAVYELVSTGSISAAQLEQINLLIERVPQRRLARDGDRFSLLWGSNLTLIEKITAPIIQDLVELLTTEDLTRLRVCGANDCGWLFVDHSKNGRRRWCDMADCGNRAKQQRYYKTHVD